jgi:3-deoxy-D-arabino-heptulosonate 7-phosphate (DAHP) synthase class II
MDRVKLAVELVRLAKTVVSGLPLFEETDADDKARALAAVLKKAAPFAVVRKMSLGGHVNLHLVVSLDPKEDWTNGILENSRYFRMSIGPEGVMKLYSGYGVGKFRQSRVTSMDEAAKKISDFIRASK